MSSKSDDEPVTMRDCCNCTYKMVYAEFYYRKSDQWLSGRLRHYKCCTVAVLQAARFLNFLMMLYGLLITVFCLFVLFGAEWLPDTFDLTNETICSSAPDPPNCTNAQIIFSDGGFDNLTWGGVAFWAAAVLEGANAFFLSPLPFAGHLNTICCGTRSLPIMRASAAFHFICFLLCIAFIVLPQFAETGAYFPPWVFSYNYVWWAANGGNGLGLLVAFSLTESFRSTFLMHAINEPDSPKRTRTTTPHGPDRYSPEVAGGEGGGSKGLEMVVVDDGENAETKTGNVYVHAPPERTWSEEVESGNVVPAAPDKPPAWEIPPDQIEDGAKIGEGFFGQCFLSKWHEQQVVVKRFKNGIRGEGADAARNNFYREVSG